MISFSLLLRWKWEITRSRTPSALVFLYSMSQNVTWGKEIERGPCMAPWPGSLALLFPFPITLAVIFHPLLPFIPGADLVLFHSLSVLCRLYAGLWADWKVNNTTVFLIREGIFLSSTSADSCFRVLQTSSFSPQLSVCLLKSYASRPSLRKTSSARPSLVNASLSRAFLYIQGPCLEVYNLNHTWVYVAMEMLWICSMPGFLTCNRMYALCDRAVSSAFRLFLP